METCGFGFRYIYRVIILIFQQSTDVASDCTSHSSESELQDSVWGCGYR
jgi:hypothetical protein